MRISWANRKEDDSKVDLICTYLNPIKKNFANTILTQVKSGNTFASIKSVDGKDFLKIKISKFTAYKKRLHSTLVVWVDNVNERFYWFIIKSNSNLLRELYDSTHEINPCLRYDLNRISSSFVSSDGGKGLMFSIDSNNPDITTRYTGAQIKSLFDNAKATYKDLVGQTIFSELFGNVEISKFGWRHITRFGRRNMHKLASYEVIGLISNLIDSTPTKHRIQHHIKSEDKAHYYRKIVYLCEYDEVKAILKQAGVIQNIKIYLKITETISYPKNWELISKLTEGIKRRVYFKSIYYKVK